MAEEEEISESKKKDILRWSKTPWGAIILYLVAVIALLWIVCNLEFVRTFSQMVANQRWFLWAVFGPPFVIWGLWFAGRRLDATRDQIEKQTTSIEQQKRAITLQGKAIELQGKTLQVQARSLHQQRFFEAIKLLGSEAEYLRFAGLESLKQLGKDADFQHLDEIGVILPAFLKEVAQSATEVFDLMTGGPVIPPEEPKIGEMAKRALDTFFEIISTHSQKEGLQDNTQYTLSNLNLTGYKLPHGTFLRSTRFVGCRLVDTDFSNSKLSNVSFEANPHNGFPTILRRATFNGTKFKGVNFQLADISATQFGNSQGIESKDLLGCIYSQNGLPDGLPSGTELGPPYQHSLEKTREGTFQTIPLAGHQFRQWGQHLPGFDFVDGHNPRIRVSNPP